MLLVCGNILAKCCVHHYVEKCETDWVREKLTLGTPEMTPKENTD